MLLSEHLFSIESLLGWALSSTCSGASGQLSHCAPSLPLSPTSGHWPWFSVLAGPPAWDSQIRRGGGGVLASGYCQAVQVFLRQFQAEILAPLSNREGLGHSPVFTWS